MSKVLIIMGSDSDLPVMSGSAKILDELGVGYHLTVVSAHRTPQRMYEYAENAANNGFKVIIAGAGGAAHLPGMVASLTDLPVIGVPIKSSNMSGIDSLYSIVQMPPGIPVATVAINGAKNAGLLAAKVLALFDNTVAHKVAAFSKNQKNQVLEKAKKLEDLGFQKYLNQMNK
jgi:5-(carboxyamino)imidazole ribonucleotide mutase